jgi:hypothetical protein
MIQTTNVTPSNSLFTKVRQRILSIFYLNPHQDYHTNEIIRLANSGTGAVQRELKNLAKGRVITAKRLGNQIRYQANSDLSYYQALRTLILHSFGLADICHELLIKPIAKYCDCAFIFGPLVQLQDQAGGNIDIFIISSQIKYEVIYRLAKNLEMRLNRPIQTTLLSKKEWQQKIADKDKYILTIRKQAKIYLLGSTTKL